MPWRDFFQSQQYLACMLLSSLTSNSPLRDTWKEGQAQKEKSGLLGLHLNSLIYMLLAPSFSQLTSSRCFCTNSFLSTSFWSHFYALASYWSAVMYSFLRTNCSLHEITTASLWNDSAAPFKVTQWSERFCTLTFHMHSAFSNTAPRH